MRGVSWSWERVKKKFKISLGFVAPAKVEKVNFEHFYEKDVRITLGCPGVISASEHIPIVQEISEHCMWDFEENQMKM